MTYFNHKDIKGSVSIYPKNLKYLLMQINSSVFPLGTYAHSFGLEHYINCGSVYDATTLYHYLHAYLKNKVIYNEALPLKLAYQYAKEANITALLTLDEEVSASSAPIETKNASHLIAQSFIVAIENLALEYPDSIFKDYQAILAQKRCVSNYSVIYGVFIASMAIELQEALSWYIYGTIENLVGVAVKTIPLGQKAGQHLTTRLLTSIEEAIQTTLKAKPQQLCLATPGFDLAAMRHETDFNRLYMS